MSDSFDFGGVHLNAPSYPLSETPLAELRTIKAYQPPVTVQRLRSEATLPSYAHEGDLGMDLCACPADSIPSRSGSIWAIHPGSFRQIPTGLAFQFPEGYAGLVMGKSSLAAKGLDVLGGVIDSGYRGEVFVMLANNTSETITIESGKKIAQLVIVPVIQADITEGVVETDTSARGTGAFGSTGGSAA
jgi:dUTP pyrophosphatase